jgi:hypothetical protein
MERIRAVVFVGGRDASVSALVVGAPIGARREVL